MHPTLWRCAPGLVLATILVASPSALARSQAPTGSGPWDPRAWQSVPASTWGARTGWVQEVYYSGEPFQGKPTRIFGYLGRPPGTVGDKHPAMVLVHGGGGKAFQEWASHWAGRGYVALAMDLSGNGPSGRLPDGGPDQSDRVKFRSFVESEVREMWTYHAVAAVMRGHSLVRSLPEVDADRVGLTGISWGGYLTCIVAGIDHRFRVAVPVYGCGFLGENSVWKDGALAAMEPDARSLWLNTFDPGRYLGAVRCPILFLNGTTDFAYPLDSYQKSYRQVRERFRQVAVVKDLPHGHIWTFREVDAFVDAALRGEPRLAKIGKPAVRDGSVTVAWRGKGISVAKADLVYTPDSGPWPKRIWKTLPAEVRSRRVSATLPPERAWVGFLAITDHRGLRTSSEHLEWVEE